MGGVTRKGAARLLGAALALAVVLPASGCRRSDSSGGRKKKRDLPEIVTIIPDVGPVPGGTLATIVTGGFSDDFQAATPTVLFGAATAPIVSVPNAFSLQVQVPGGSAPGCEDVTVDAVSGDSATLVCGYLYVTVPPCVIFSVCPDQGDPAGGDTVLITGDGFGSPAEVYFGGVPSPRVAFISGQEIEADVPAAVAGPGGVEVLVADPFASCSIIDGYSYRVSPYVDDRLEPNDDPRNCTPETLPFTETGLTISATSDPDLFCFSVAARPATITLTPDPAGGNLDLELYEATRGQLVSRSDGASGPEVIVTPSGAADYYVRVYGACGDLGTYDLDGR